MPNDLSSDYEKKSVALLRGDPFNYEAVTRETFDSPQVFEYIHNQPDKFAQHT